MDNRFSTLDAYLGGFLLLAGHRPRLENQGGKIAFVFTQSDALRRSLDEYTSGAIVNASALVFQIKALKSRIHEVRREKGEDRGSKTAGTRR